MKKVLFVDQFSKTEGNDTLQLIEKINSFQSEFVVEAFFASGTELLDRNYKTKIHYGFDGAYQGNLVKKGINYLKALKQLKKYIINEKIDIVHLQWFSLPWFESSFVKKIKKYAKVVITVHDVIPFKTRIGEMSALKRIYHQANILLLHSEHAKDEFNKIYNPNRPISLISSAFCNKDDYEVIDANSARNHLNIPADSFVVLYYGTIRESKGLDVLISAIKIAHKKNDKIFLLSGGAFQGVDEKQYLDASKEIVDLNYGKIVFDFISKEDEKYYFSASDVLCLPYKSGWQSGVAQLGLVYELPLIASDIKEMDEIVLNNFNGERFVNKDAESLADVIVKMSNNPDMLKKYRSNSNKLYLEKYTLDKKAEDVIKAYSEICK